MNKREVVSALKKILKTYKLKGNKRMMGVYAITGSAEVLLGISNETRDVDLACTSLYANELEKRGFKTEVLADGTRKITIAESEDDDLVVWEYKQYGEKDVVVVNGVRVISAPSLLEMVEELYQLKHNEKYVAKIERIKAFLAEQCKTI